MLISVRYVNESTVIKEFFVKMAESKEGCTIKSYPGIAKNFLKNFSRVSHTYRENNSCSYI